MRRALLVAALLLAACEDRAFMAVQPRVDAYDESDFFDDGRAMRPPVPGAVPQERRAELMLARTMGAPDAGAGRLPIALTREKLEKARADFETFCATCHGVLANGDTVVASKMSLRRPPNLLAPHDHRVQVAFSGPAVAAPELPHPLNFYVVVMTDGFGLMPSYAEELTLEDRWAVAAYLRALARSQNAPLAAAPPEERKKLEEARR